MELPPSKLSSAASRVWNESAGQFHKKTELKMIDLGLQKISSSSNNANAAATSPGKAAEDGGTATAAPTTTEKASTASIPPSGYIFGSRVFERVVTKADSSTFSTTAASSTTTNANVGGAKPSVATDSAEPSEKAGQHQQKPLDVSSIFRRVAQKTAVDGHSGGVSTSTNGGDAGSMWRTAAATNGGAKGEELLRRNKDQQLSESANDWLASRNGGGQQATADDQHQQITTGEEGERNLLQISCKFYQYSTEEKKWQERGMGTLRLNQHVDARDDVRLVGRQSGSQRVLINSKIFPEMLLEELSEKRLKISAHTGDPLEVPQLFLVQASPASIASLQQLLRMYIDASGLTKAMAASSASRKRRITNEHVEEKEKKKETGGAEGSKKFVEDKDEKRKDKKQQEEEKEEEDEAGEKPDEEEKEEEDEDKDEDEEEAKEEVEEKEEE